MWHRVRLVVTFQKSQLSLFFYMHDTDMSYYLWGVCKGRLEKAPPFHSRPRFTDEEAKVQASAQSLPAFRGWEGEERGRGGRGVGSQGSKQKDGMPWGSGKQEGGLQGGTGGSEGWSPKQQPHGEGRGHRGHQ